MIETLLFCELEQLLQTLHYEIHDTEILCDLEINVQSFHDFSFCSH